MTILLLLTRDEVESKIQTQIDRGAELRDRFIPDRSDLDEWIQALARWREYTYQLLRKIFSDEEPAVQFSQYAGFAWAGPVDSAVEMEQTRREIGEYINRLRSLLELVDGVYDEAPTVAATTPASAQLGAEIPKGTAVFIVHGRAGRQAEVARAVEHIGLEALILQEKLHGGSATVIGKLEREASTCGYALVIYTGDDEGRIFGSGDDFTRRARENVVLELGYFVGLLGRDNVTILRDSEVTIPSDFHGVGYYDLDEAGAWKTSVEGELRRAGLLSS